jgi:hypothetical protein
LRGIRNNTHNNNSISDFLTHPPVALTDSVNPQASCAGTVFLPGPTLREFSNTTGTTAVMLKATMMPK